MLESESEESGIEEPIPDPLIGRTLNERYRIVAPIGVGGMGKVYKAVQMPLERAVALKVLDPAYASSADPNFLRRFMREASLTAQLRHPNTVTVIDYGQTGNIYYIAMEYLEGLTLSKLLVKQGPLSWPRALEIAQQICRSLREAHKLGVVHRDLKPANVMVMSEADTDLVKVLDFGLVKSLTAAPELEDDAPLLPASTYGLSSARRGPDITQHGMFLGSPTYMAPEQAKNHLDLRSDIYSLGVVLYQMLMGRPPFLSKDHVELIFAHHREPPPPFNLVRPDIHVPPEVESVVMRCLRKQPEARFQSMDDVLEAMRVAATSAGLSGVFPRATTGTFRMGSLPLPQQPPTPSSDTMALDISVDEPTVHERAGARLMPLLVVVGALALLGGAALLNRWLKGPAPTPIPLSSLPDPAPAPARANDLKREPEREAAATAPRFTRFQVSSEPEGAQVYWKGDRMGVTPTEFDVGLDKGGSASAELTFELEGYHPETVIAGGSGDVVLMQRLRKMDTRPEPRAAPGRAPPAAPRRAGAPAAGSNDVQPNDPSDPEPPTVVGVGSITLPPPEPPREPLSPAAAPAAETALPFGDGMSRPVQLEGEDVVYTQEALAANVEGEVLVRCVITAQGRLEDCKILKGLPHLDEAVLRALETHIYMPVTQQGRPVAVNYVFSIRLRPPAP